MKTRPSGLIVIGGEPAGPYMCGSCGERNVDERHVIDCYERHAQQWEDFKARRKLRALSEKTDVDLWRDENQQALIERRKKL